MNSNEKIFLTGALIAIAGITGIIGTCLYAPTKYFFVYAIAYTALLLIGAKLMFDNFEDYL